MFDTTVEQNKAHRADLDWVKIGPSEYMRSDGVRIKRNCMTSRWEFFEADGSRMQQWGMPGSAHSLTVAKYEVKTIVAERVQA